MDNQIDPKEAAVIRKMIERIKTNPDSVGYLARTPAGERAFALMISAALARLEPSEPDLFVHGPAWFDFSVAGHTFGRRARKGMLLAFLVLHAPGQRVQWSICYPSSAAAKNALRRAAQAAGQASGALERAILAIGVDGPHAVLRRPVAGVLTRWDAPFLVRNATLLA